MKRASLLVLPLALACIGVMGCARHPISAKSPPVASTPSKAPTITKAAGEASTAEKTEKAEKALEIAIGTMVEALANSSHGEYNDAALSAYVTEIGMRIAKRSERPDLPWHFQLLDTEDVLAHALPGGRVTISRGLLAFLGSEAEVAAVLAHEVAHVAFRHSHSKWSPSAAVAEIGSTADDRERLRNADQERQADTVGARYLAAAGYDPRAMVTALSAVERGAKYMRDEKLKNAPASKADTRKRADDGNQEEDDDSWDPHPAPPTRLARAAVAAGSAFQAAAGGAAGANELGRDRYLSRIANIEWGQGSATPLLIGERYVLPGDLTFAIPRGYKAKSDGGMLQAKVSGASDDDDGASALFAMRFQKSLVSEALKKSITKGPHVAREIAGRPAFVARFDPKAKSKKSNKSGKSDDNKNKETKKSNDGLMAVIEGPTSVVLVAINGDSQASERTLDGFLATAERDTAARKPRSVVVVERVVDAKQRFEDFVRIRCAGTSVEMASALNDGRAARSELVAGTLIKCVQNRPV